MPERPGAYVSDIFNEVDEEIRREQFKRLWDRWGNYILAAAVLFVIAIAGWRAWDWYETKKGQEAGAAFESALERARAGKNYEAETAFAKVAKDSPSGYRMLARFREAAELAARDPAAGVKAYDAIAADSGFGRTLQELAAI